MLQKLVNRIQNQVKLWLKKVRYIFVLIFNRGSYYQFIEYVPEVQPRKQVSSIDAANRAIVSASDVAVIVELAPEKSVKLAIEVTFLPGAR